VVLEFSAPGPELFIFREQVCPEFVIANTDGDVSEPAQVAQRDFAFGVDAVAADAVVGGRLERAVTALLLTPVAYPIRPNLRLSN